MKTKIFTIFLALATCVGTMSAKGIKIGGLYYNLDATNQTAEVTGPSCSGNLVIPQSVSYETITYSVISIGYGAFAGCSDLTSIEIPNSVTSIGNGAFYGCTSLTTIEIPNSVTSIGDDTFYGCTSLTSVEIPNSVTSIGDRAFEGCSGLTSVTIPNSVTSIGSEAFQYCSSLTSVTIPNSVTSIGKEAFYECTGLTSVTIGNSVTSIGRETFAYCSGLSSVTIGNSVTSIGDNAFYGCTSLTSVEIPNSVTSIGDRAFSGCTSLTAIEIPNSVTSIGLAFSECTNLTHVLLNCNEIVSKEYYSWNYDATIPSIFGRQVIEYVIGDSVTSIGNNAFYSGRYIKSVKMSDNIVSIGESAFVSCDSLKSVKLGNGLKQIGNSAFYRCHGLDSIVLPHIETIGAAAFKGSSVTSITLGHNITSIGEGAFALCRDLSSITCYATTPPSYTGESESLCTFRNLILYVPSQSIDEYKNAPEWKYFFQQSQILPIGATPTEVNTTTTIPGDNYVDILWQIVTNATTYELIIKDNIGNIICTLIFNANGQLLTIHFNAPGKNSAPQSTQSAGFAFTVTGLERGTTYIYSLVARNSDGETLDTQSGTFTTQGSSTCVENDIPGNQNESKLLRDGQIYILRGDRTYTVTGQEVR